MTPLFRYAILASALLPAASCTPRSQPHPVGLAPATSSAAVQRCVAPEARRVLDRFVESNRGRYQASMVQARQFLDSLDIDPQALRAHQIKGKKKLVEALDAYYRLYQVAPPADRPVLLARVKALAAVTARPGYHDMLTIDDREFKEDATSYLRAALLLDQMGVDTTSYREHIAACKGRLDAHLRDRGPHQRRAFHGYYKHFGLTEPMPLASALEAGLIAHRADPETLGRMDTYGLTHEIFAAYEFGDRLDSNPFGEADRAYLRTALPGLLTRWMARNDADLVAELVSCTRYVREVGDPSYTRAVTFLLAGQNSDGSFGNYASRARYGDYLKQALYLHTTMVAMDALSIVFEDLFRRGEDPACAP